MTNGGTGPTLKGDLILVNSGRGTIAPNIALVNPKPPNNVTVILNNYYGRQFNSLNDAKIHPTNGNLFFTDTLCVNNALSISGCEMLTKLLE
jgi:gluconolactonase